MLYFFVILLIHNCFADLDLAVNGLFLDRFVNERPRPLSFLKGNNLMKEEMKNITAVLEDQLVIETNLQVGYLSNLDVVNMEFSMIILFRLRWQDPRLRLEPNYKFERYSISYRRNDLWIPDLQFANLKSAKLHNVSKENLMINLNSEGVLTLSRRISLTLECFMDLTSFPFDVQKCPMVVQGLSTDDILLYWWSKNAYDVYGSQSDPFEKAIDIDHTVQLHEFTLKSYTCSYCSKQVNTIGNFSCVMGVFTFKRLLGYYMIFAYLPTFLLVCIAWLSFFIDYTLAPSRTLIGLFGLFSLITNYESILAKTPDVSYFQAIDVWFFSCIAFVSSALFEYAIVNLLWRKKREKRVKFYNFQVSRDNSISSIKFDESLDKNADTLKNVSNKNYVIELISNSKVNSEEEFWMNVEPERLDQISAILYAILLITWNIWYWTKNMMFRSEDQICELNPLSNATHSTQKF